jgi:hypothetical protein
MTQPKIYHAMNYTERKPFQEVNNQPSMTIPDQSMSMRDILDRFASGLPMDGERVSMYEEDDNVMPDGKKMDLVEVQEMMMQNKAYIDKTEKAMYEDTVKTERDKITSEIIAKYEAEKKKKSDAFKKPDPSEPGTPSVPGEGSKA